MISISSVVVLLPLIMSFAAGGSFYHLLNAKEDTEKSSTAGTLFFSKKFFECDREENCTHVANLIETDSLVMVYGEHEMKKLPINAFVWAKIKEVCKAPKIITKELQDIAVNKSTRQSSTSKGMQSSLANDGDSSTCSKTHISKNAYLILDLEKEALVSSVKLMAGNVFGVDKFDIVIGNADGVSKVCVSQIPVSPGKIESFTCPTPMRGRYVAVFQTYDGYSSLSLCELQVFGTFEK